MFNIPYPKDFQLSHIKDEEDNEEDFNYEIDDSIDSVKIPLNNQNIGH